MKIIMGIEEGREARDRCLLDLGEELRHVLIRIVILRLQALSHVVMNDILDPVRHNRRYSWIPDRPSIFLRLRDWFGLLVPAPRLRFWCLIYFRAFFLVALAMLAMEPPSFFFFFQVLAAAFIAAL